LGPAGVRSDLRVVPPAPPEPPDPRVMVGRVVLVVSYLRVVLVGLHPPQAHCASSTDPGESNGLADNRDSAITAKSERIITVAPD